MRQAAFGFIDRAQRLERKFKLIIALATAGSIVFFLTALSPGRYLSGWVAARARELGRQAVGLPPDRGEIDAGWKRKRLFDIEQSHGSLKSTFAEYSPAAQRLLRYAGLDPDHALVRWGNFDRTVLLPSTVFEPDQNGRSYRFRPNMRSIWVRNFPMKGPVKAYFQVPDRPELAEVVTGTSAQIVDGSTQTTNSWGLRGPEPDVAAPWRGIVLGDSYMQGLFVGDQETPVECLKRDLTIRLEAPVEILNTGHLGYSPEQYYYSLMEYGEALSAPVRRGQPLRQRLRRFSGSASGQGRLAGGELLARPDPRLLHGPRSRVPCRTSPVGKPGRGASNVRELPRQDC